MSLSIRKTDAVAKAILHFCFQLAERTGSKDLADELAATVGQLEARPPGIDGRATSWTDERRAKVGARISAAWEAKRAAKSEEHRFLQYTYADQPPKTIDGLEALSKATGLAVSTLRNRLSVSPSGFMVKPGRFHVAYVRHADDLEKLCQAPALLSGNSDDAIRLPSKKGNRF